MHRKILGPDATGGPAPRSGQPCRVAEQLSDRTRPLITGNWGGYLVIIMSHQLQWHMLNFASGIICISAFKQSSFTKHEYKCNKWLKEWINSSRHCCCCSGFVYFSEMSSHCQIASHLWLVGFENSQPVPLQWRAFRADGLVNFEVPFRVDSASVFARRLFIWNFIHQAFNSSVHTPNVFNERTLSGVFHVLFSLNMGLLDSMGS